MTKILLYLFTLSLFVACSGADNTPCAKIEKAICEGKDEAFCTKAKAAFHSQKGPDGSAMGPEIIDQFCTMMANDPALEQWIKGFQNTVK